MDDGVKYSVIIPCHNSTKTVSKAIFSAVSSDTEVICVDDFSTDGTLEMLLSLQKDGLVRVVSLKENHGPGYAINRGIEQAVADLIFVLGHDNFMPHGLIQTLDRARVEAGADIAAPAEIHYFGGRKKMRTNPHKDGVCDIGTYVKTRKNHGSCGHYLFTKESWLKAGGYPEELGNEGWVFGLRQLAAGCKAIIVPGTHYFHRLSKNSLWKKLERRGLNDKAIAKALKDCSHMLEKNNGTIRSTQTDQRREGRTDTQENRVLPA